METAGAKHGRRVGIVYSNLEANQVARIESARGLSFPCRGLAPSPMAHGSLDVNQPLKSHHLREEPAPVPHLVEGSFDWIPASDQPAVDDVLHMPRPLGFVERPRVTRRGDHGLAAATPRTMFVEPVEDGHQAPVLLASVEDDEPLLLDERDADVRDLGVPAEESEPWSMTGSLPCPGRQMPRPRPNGGFHPLRFPVSSVD
jgi:hypothetical protein